MPPIETHVLRALSAAFFFSENKSAAPLAIGQPCFSKSLPSPITVGLRSNEALSSQPYYGQPGT